MGEAQPDKPPGSSRRGLHGLRPGHRSAHPVRRVRRRPVQCGDRGLPRHNLGLDRDRLDGAHPLDPPGRTRRSVHGLRPGHRRGRPLRRVPRALRVPRHNLGVERDHVDEAAGDTAPAKAGRSSDGLRPVPRRRRPLRRRRPDNNQALHNRGLHPDVLHNVGAGTGPHRGDHAEPPDTHLRRGDRSELHRCGGRLGSARVPRGHGHARDRDDGGAGLVHGVRDARHNRHRHLHLPSAVGHRAPGRRALRGHGRLHPRDTVVIEGGLLVPRRVVPAGDVQREEDPGDHDGPSHVDPGHTHLRVRDRAGLRRRGHRAARPRLSRGHNRAHELDEAGARGVLGVCVRNDNTLHHPSSVTWCRPRSSRLASTPQLRRPSFPAHRRHRAPTISTKVPRPRRRASWSGRSRRSRRSRSPPTR